MDDKKLRKISKRELLEILLAQSQKIEELEAELKNAQDAVMSKKIQLEEAGSIAEASLRLNKIFERAQEAADQYLMNVEEKCKELELKAQKELEKVQKKSEKKEKIQTKRRSANVSIKKKYNNKTKEKQESKKVKTNEK